LKRLLVLSNGAGEDAIAVRILGRLPQPVRDAVLCCPLVGPGKALEEGHFELVGPRVLPPSEGLFRESWSLAMRDLWQGVLAGHLRQLAFLRQQRDRFALTLSVGDLFPVLWAGLAGLTSQIFVGTAKSVYHHPYSLPERAVLRRFCHTVMVRDQATAQRLSGQGLPACWLGNAMMDEIAPTGRPLPLAPEGPLLTLFPGSRQQAPEVLPFQLEVVARLRSRFANLQAAVAAAPGAGQAADLSACCLEQGWELHSCPGEGALGVLQRDGLAVPILQRRLGDLLARSSVVLGQAGTANEQAAGAGVPVVAFDQRGEKGLRWYRKRQKGLLGEAVKVVPQTLDSVVEELAQLLSDPAERERRGQIGRQRMGPAGGTQRMADVICQLWNG
jgi:uncharacterized protein (TIGR03492 family)